MDMDESMREMAGAFEERMRMIAGRSGGCVEA